MYPLTVNTLVRLTNSISTTPEIPCNKTGAIRLHFPVGYVSTSIEIWDKTPDGNYSNTGLTITVPDVSTTRGSVRVDLKSFPASSLKLVTNQNDSTKDVGVVGK